MEKKIMIEYEKNLMKKFDGMIEEIHTFHDGFSEESMQRMEYELLQVKDNRDIFSVFEEESLQLDNDILDELEKFDSEVENHYMEFEKAKQIWKDIFLI